MRLSQGVPSRKSIMLYTPARPPFSAHHAPLLPEPVPYGMIGEMTDMVIMRIYMEFL